MTEEFKKMPLKKKAEHIWEYYRTPIFLTIAAVFIFGSLINVIFINPAPKTYAGVAFYDNYVNSERLSQLTEDMTSRFVSKDENLQVKFSTYYSSESDPTVAVDMGQKFEMMLFAGELDIVAANEEFFLGFIEQGLYVPLDTVYSDEEISTFEKENLIVYSKDQNGAQRPFGLWMKNTETALKDYEGFPQNERCAGITAMSERKENAKKVLTALVG